MRPQAKDEARCSKPGDDPCDFRTLAFALLLATAATTPTIQGSLSAEKASPYVAKALGCFRISADLDEAAGHGSARLCFLTGGKYLVYWSACVWGAKAPCEGHVGFLDYRWDGETLSMQKIEATDSKMPTFCTQPLVGIAPVQFVACAMPTLEWTRTPNDLVGSH